MWKADKKIPNKMNPECAFWIFHKVNINFQISPFDTLMGVRIQIKNQNFFNPFWNKLVVTTVTGKSLFWYLVLSWKVCFIFYKSFFSENLQAKAVTRFLSFLRLSGSLVLVWQFPESPTEIHSIFLNISKHLCARF